MKPKKPCPRDWPRISSAVFYADPRAAIDWLCRAFGFEVRLLVEGPDGSVAHSELEYGEGLIMVAGTAPSPGKSHEWLAQVASPKQLDGRFTQNLCVHVDDADAHCAAARAAGARVCYEPKTSDYGADYWADRSYAAYDCEGHMWWFMQRVTTGGVPHGQ